MIQPLIELYKLIKEKKTAFTDRGLAGEFFIDIYRGQPFTPELFEYFPLPAIFADFQITGQGKNQPRKVTMTLHVLTDVMPDASNISENQIDGLKRFMYHLTLQDILEGAKLGATSQLKFINEALIDVPVINYHTQIYEFESYLNHLFVDESDYSVGEFTRANTYGQLNEL
jgi:hypothetical protein